jgi:hypothetical protein
MANIEIQQRKNACHAKIPARPALVLAAMLVFPAIPLSCKEPPAKAPASQEIMLIQQIIFANPVTLLA